MKKLGVFLGVIVIALLTAVLMAFPTMWAWNAFMPKVFGLIEINFTDALWFNILASVFKSSTSSSKE